MDTACRRLKQRQSTKCWTTKKTPGRCSGPQNSNNKTKGPRIGIFSKANKTNTGFSRNKRTKDVGGVECCQQQAQKASAICLSKAGKNSQEGAPNGQSRVRRYCTAQLGPNTIAQLIDPTGRKPATLKLDAFGHLQPSFFVSLGHQTVACKRPSQPANKATPASQVGNDINI